MPFDETFDRKFPLLRKKSKMFYVLLFKMSFRLKIFWSQCLIQKVLHIYRRKQSLRQGNIFTSICNSVHSGEGLPKSPRCRPPGCRPPGGYGQQAGGTHPTGMLSCFAVTFVSISGSVALCAAYISLVHSFLFQALLHYVLPVHTNYVAIMMINFTTTTYTTPTLSTA